MKGISDGWQDECAALVPQLQLRTGNSGDQKRREIWDENAERISSTENPAFQTATCHLITER